MWGFDIFTFRIPILSRLGDVGRRESSFVADEMINTPASEIISSATKEDSLLPSYPDGASRLGELSKNRRYPLTSKQTTCIGNPSGYPPTEAPRSGHVIFLLVDVVLRRRSTPISIGILRCFGPLPLNFLLEMHANPEILKISQFSTRARAGRGSSDRVL